MSDRTSGAEQFLAAYKNGGDQGATAVNAPAPTEFNEHLVAAVNSLKFPTTMPDRVTLSCDRRAPTPMTPVFMATFP